MKRGLLIVGMLVAGYIAYIIVSLAMMPSVAKLADRRHSLTITVRDWKGKERPLVLGPRNPRWVSISQVPSEMQWAVIVAEDSNFYRHEGLDVKAMKKAIKYDLEKKSLARGASTITQQVAKNIYLSREKTITRKIKEVYLAWRMEQELTKGRILELYLNVVELGPMVYGIGHGSQYYFGKHPSAMSPAESSFLAAMLPGPRVAYNPYRNIAKVERRALSILKKLHSRGLITDEEFQIAQSVPININGLQRKVDETLQHEPIQTAASSAHNTAPPIQTSPPTPLSTPSLDSRTHAH